LGITSIAGLQAALDGKAASTHSHAISDVTGLQTELDSKANSSSLGTASSSDVTTSTTDTTAGRLLKVGDFGVGGDSIVTATNANDLILPGQTWVANFDTLESAAAAGYPNLGTGATPTWWNTQTYGTSTRLTQFTQQAYNLVSYVERTFFRTRHDSTWSPWREIYHTGNILGTVSQSGGIPTGAIIERGSNVNGEYVKYADGTIEMVAVGLYTSDTTASGNIFASAEFLFSLPAPVIDKEKAAITVNDYLSSLLWFGASFNSTTQGKARMFYFTGLSGVRSFRAKILGRWN
jgi:hypothetical protein